MAQISSEDEMAERAEEDDIVEDFNDFSDDEWTNNKRAFISLMES